MPVILTGGAYPHNLPLVTLDGKAVNLSDLKGKVVFVNLWAAWCPPCRAEMPGIEALYKKVDKSKVAFLMLSLDDDAAKARKFVQAQGYTFPVYMRTGDLPAPLTPTPFPPPSSLAPMGRWQRATRAWRSMIRPNSRPRWSSWPSRPARLF
ncbi:TlpA family protein disulfide reductase [Hymenobacter humi]|uniref:TlpA family protein disulfide reductase n=1 Tax=Hymenobacter humi TaxID=1411620 RepID=A0ABW2UF70_9BACT